MSKRQNPQPFAPKFGEVYENAGGGRYLCESRDESVRSAWMVNTASGWSFTAVNIVRYEDGTIEWDYSKDGSFIPIDDRRKDMIERATIRQKQRSIMNAMLCCLI